MNIKNECLDMNMNVTLNICTERQMLKNTFEVYKHTFVRNSIRRAIKWQQISCKKREFNEAKMRCIFMNANYGSNWCNECIVQRIQWMGEWKFERKTMPKMC